MSKERLDLMVEEETKRLLRSVAAAEGISMSQLVENMLMEHLSDGTYDLAPSSASPVADMLWLLRLHDEFVAAQVAGTIYPFRTYCKMFARDELPETDAPVVLYLGEQEGRFREGDFVLDCCVDELHDDIVSTYDDVLTTVSVRIGWAEEDGELVPWNMRIYPKNRAKGNDSLFDWDCANVWPGFATIQPDEGR